MEFPDGSTEEDVRIHTMGHSREKKPIAETADAIKEAESIVEDFKDFTDGVRVLILLHRSKDGASYSTRHERMLFSRDEKEFKEVLSYLIEIQNRRKNLRIYSSVNKRNLKKAIRNFKVDQLDIDYQSEEQQLDFYLQIKSRFASCLMRPQSKDDSLFLFDVDEPQTLDDALGILDSCSEKPEIVTQYKTKNGWHIVTKPFNHTKLKGHIPVNTDGLLLLKY